MRRPCVFVALLTVALFGVACSQATTTTSPSTTTTSTSTTVTEVMSSTLAVGGSRFYSFSIHSAGTVTATLQDLSGTNVSPGTIVNLGIGVPSGTTCSGTQTNVQITGSAGLNAYVTAAEQSAGQFCVIISDVGNLFAPASFTVTIDHP
ncbi:MAG: hypothetical protein U0Q11_26700 [Vicinamibacterales bacterium]